MVDRIIFGSGAVALICLGFSMIIRPKWAALKSRDDDVRPVTAGELWSMRVIGIGIVLACAYGLYAMVTGMPGAEFGTP